MPLDRPIPAFYCCYLLRSAVRHSSVYIGSTPNPVRRLRQHNGIAKGGAVRTSRKSLRPWEMSCIVTGFPSNIAALQFEWAWQNPHITLHIPPEARIQHATQKKRSGHPKRPRHSVTSLLSNLHVLLRVPSFSRWPLEVRFFSEDVHKSWLRWCKAAALPIRDSIKIIKAFQTDAVSSGSESGSPSGKSKKIAKSGGIVALSVDYSDHKAHVEKAKGVFEFEQEGQCVLCKEELEHDAGIYAICPKSGCDSVTHLTCLSKHFLKDQNEVLVPLKGTCPSCKADLQWIDVVKELTLRTRGQKDIEKLLKVKRARKGKGATASQALVDEDEEDDDEAEAMEMKDEMEQLKQFDETATGISMGDTWASIDDSDDSDGSISSNASQTKKQESRKKIEKKVPVTIIEDSDWDDALEL